MWVFPQERVYVLDNSFLQSTVTAWMDSYGQNSKNEVLKKNPYALHKNLLRSSKIGVWCKQCHGTAVLWRPITAENYLNVLTKFVAPLEGMNQIAGFSKRACLTTWQKQQPSHMTSMNEAQTLAIMIPWLISVGLSKQRVYSNNPRILEDLKHNNELAAASTDQHTP
jgi:hypothetical protein